MFSITTYLLPNSLMFVSTCLKNCLLALSSAPFYLSKSLSYVINLQHDLYISHFIINCDCLVVDTNPLSCVIYSLQFKIAAARKVIPQQIPLFTRRNVMQRVPASVIVKSWISGRTGVTLDVRMRSLVLVLIIYYDTDTTHLYQH